MKSKPHTKSDAMPQQRAGTRTISDRAGNEEAVNEPDRTALRDPGEPTQGPLRFDDTNYSPERLSLPEGNYNTYDDYDSALDEEKSLQRDNLDPHFPETSQREILDQLSPDEAAPLQPTSRGDSAADLPESWQTAGQTPDAASDLGILGAINDVLSQFVDADVASIDVTVQDGVVVLDGEVAEAASRTRIMQAVDAIADIRAIRNHLTVRGESAPPRWSDE